MDGLLGVEVGGARIRLQKESGKARPEVVAVSAPATTASRWRWDPVKTPS